MTDLTKELLKHQTFMRTALKAAASSDQDIPIGALIVINDEIIAAFCNEKEKRQDPTAHAEILAIQAACKRLGTWRLADAVLYTTLEPCPMCAEAILQSRVGTLIFGAYDPLSGACGSAFNLYKEGRIYPPPETLGGILEEECSNVLKVFFRERKALT